jgi:hypothetical protein
MTKLMTDVHKICLHSESGTCFAVIMEPFMLIFFKKFMCFLCSFQEAKMGKKKKSKRVVLRCAECNEFGHQEGQCPSRGPEALSRSVQRSGDGSSEIVDAQAAPVQGGAVPAAPVQAAAVDAVAVLPPAHLAHVQQSTVSF